MASVKVAINDEFADWQHKLQDGDTVVFIPPVAGG
jgi:molybdopterin converting factor small subunit